MAVKVRLLICILALTLASGPGWSTTHAQLNPVKYIPETGHTVSGEFLLKYLSVPNPEQIYGYPITEPFQDSNKGIIIQYFQKARFELHPEAAVGQRVQPTPLGRYLINPGQPLSLAANASACRYFPVTGFSVCFGFLTFFEAHGGVAVFGYPISNLEFHKDQIVQNFELARLEWRQNYPAGEQVVVTDLGSQYFFIRGEDPIRLNPVEDVFSPDNVVLKLRVRAFPLRAVTGARGLQTVFISVQDQKRAPIQNAQVAFTVRMPSGQEIKYIIPARTNSIGLTQFSFPFDHEMIGLVEINVTAYYEQLQGSTRTSFRIWW